MLGEATFDVAGEQFGIFVGEFFIGQRDTGAPVAIDDQSAGMRFDSTANLRPLRGVDPNATVFHRKLSGRWIFDEFWHTRSARFPFRSVALATSSANRAAIVAGASVLR